MATKSISFLETPVSIYDKVQQFKIDAIQDYFQQVPKDVVSLIFFNFVSLQDLANVACCSKKLRDIVYELPALKDFPQPELAEGIEKKSPVINLFTKQLESVKALTLQNCVFSRAYLQRGYNAFALREGVFLNGIEKNTEIICAGHFNLLCNDLFLRIQKNYLIQADLIATLPFSEESEKSDFETFKERITQWKWNNPSQDMKIHLESIKTFGERLQAQYAQNKAHLSNIMNNFRDQEFNGIPSWMETSEIMEEFCKESARYIDLKNQNCTLGSEYTETISRILSIRDRAQEAFSTCESDIDKNITQISDVTQLINICVTTSEQVAQRIIPFTKLISVFDDYPEEKNLIYPISMDVQPPEEVNLGDVINCAVVISARARLSTRLDVTLVDEQDQIVYFGLKNEGEIGIEQNKLILNCFSLSLSVEVERVYWLKIKVGDSLVESTPFTAKLKPLTLQMAKVTQEEPSEK
jgi:hypothetical protein